MSEQVPSETLDFAPVPCMRPPKGWVCTRDPGHDGPCAAWPVNSAQAAEQIERLKSCLRASHEAYIRVVRQSAGSRAMGKQIVEIINGIENRCMAAEGPVTNTRHEMTDDELRRIYVLAGGKIHE